MPTFKEDFSKYCNWKYYQQKLKHVSFIYIYRRQLRKNAQANDGASGPPGYHEYHESVQPYLQSQQVHHPQQQSTQHQQPITVFGVSSGSGGSIRSFKKTAPASGSRLAVNELFNHGPPLPPANQHSMQKNKHLQQQQQQQSAQSQLPPNHHQQQQQVSPQSLSTPVVGRNISAMLDENNTVRCYLEPLEK